MEQDQIPEEIGITTWVANEIKKKQLLNKLKKEKQNSQKRIKVLKYYLTHIDFYNSASEALLTAANDYNLAQ